MINLALDPTTPAEAVEGDYGRVVAAGIRNHPRSLQEIIGPSELGIPCTRALIHKLAQHPEPPAPIMETRLEAPIGTAFHAQLEEWFTADNANYAAPRWHVEQKVMVGVVGGQEIWGSCDLFDGHTGYVLDHKVVGATKLKNYKANGPGPQYRAQAHCYGRGWRLKGWAVQGVAIAFIPRATGTIRDIHVWSEPFDEQHAIDTVTKADRLAQAIHAFGADQLLAMYPPCGDRWCDWCAPENQVTKIQAAEPFNFAATK